MMSEKEQHERTESAGGPTEETGTSAGEVMAEVSEDIHRQVLKERDEYLDTLQRLQADFANYRKRVARESDASSSRVTAEIVEELLPVLDNFERALKAAVEHDEKVLSEGVQLVYRQLREVLDRRGLCEIEAAGEDFDPSHHEAVLCQPSEEHPEGRVIDVLEKGYRVHDKVVRPARVIVSEGESEGDDS
ncbi:MAG: nucleotide exchange factor GrpE [Gaiellales bacterium]|nr:MAG: nucleotide exchange factor GrpE [Gaiellales bacterium]